MELGRPRQLKLSLGFLPDVLFRETGKLVDVQLGLAEGNVYPVIGDGAEELAWGILGFVSGTEKKRSILAKI